MKRGAPQGIEIAPASDFGLSFRNFRVHAPSCLDAYNVLDSQRQDVIATAYEAPHTGGHDKPDSFSNNIVFGHEN